MIDFLLHKREYAGALKFRCVDRATLDLDTIKDSVRKRYFADVGISDASFERFWRTKAHASSGGIATISAIENNYSYLFRSAPPYRPGRFNTDKFAALYTAKEIETSKVERFHYLSGRTRDFEYVVYSVEVTAVAVDLRPFVFGATLSLDADHTQCQDIASNINGRVDGVAWPSVRARGGSCCAFFSISGVRPKQIEEEGVEKPI